MMASENEAGGKMRLLDRVGAFRDTLNEASSDESSKVESLVSLEMSGTVENGNRKKCKPFPISSEYASEMNDIKKSPPLSRDML